MSTKPRISVVVNTLNEEKNIKKCLESVKWANEIVVVDMYSDDRTQAIAREFTPHVYTYQRTGYVEPARNFALGKATCDWILLVDADEVVPPALANKLCNLHVDREENTYAYRLAEKNIMFGQWIRHTGWWPDPHIRFFKRGMVKWDDSIHSTPQVISGVVVDLPFEEQFAIEHYPYATRRDFIEKLNKYTDHEASRMLISGKHFSVGSSLIRAGKEFIFRYICAGGFRDGQNGFILSVYMAFYYFLAYTKLLDLAKENK